MGKSSLLMRTVSAGMDLGKRVALLDFQLVDEDGKAHADLFFRRFASWVAEQLDLPDSVDKFWNAGYSNPQNCTRYMEQHILEPLGGPCIVAIDETDAIFQTTFSQDFFSMLRSWHNRRADPTRRSWKKLDIILSTSTEPQFFIDRPHESPFNVGVTLRLEDFQPDQVGRLNALHPRPLASGDVERLYNLVHGHPYLTRKALYMVAGSTPTCSVDELFATRPGRSRAVRRSSARLPAAAPAEDGSDSGDPAGRRMPHVDRRARDLPAGGAGPGPARRSQSRAAMRAVRRIFPRTPQKPCLTRSCSSPAAPSRRAAASTWSGTRTASCCSTASPETSPTS